MLSFLIMLTALLSFSESNLGCFDNVQYGSNCKYWKSAGYCYTGDKKNEFMAGNCAKSCGFCTVHSQSNYRSRTCSTMTMNTMDCSCLSSLYRTTQCVADIRIGARNCATYSHHCESQHGKRKQKYCCRAILCYRKRRGC